ncbi:MAG: flagellin FliC [Bdellovibrionales bacterium]|nr:flagellin FliC [Bdellovibrionales bacterium]
MGLRIRTNTAALSGIVHINRNTEALKKSQERAASGSKLEKAQADPTGLALSETLRLQPPVSIQNIRNLNDGLSYLETADGALEEMTNILIRMRELSMQSATGTVGNQDRTYINDEYQVLKEEIERLARTTGIADKLLLSGEGDNVIVQVGLNHRKYDSVDVTAPHEVTLDRLEISPMHLTTMEDAGDSLVQLDKAISKVAAVRGAIGASESRLSSLISSREEYENSLAVSRSMLRDTDYALESATVASLNILSQTGVALLAQANNVPQLALKLLS